MKKYNIKMYGQNYKNVYLIENIEDYKEYLIELNNKFEVSEKEIKELDTFMGHGHSVLTGVAGMFSGIINDKEKRTPMLAHLKLLHSKVLTSQLKHILNGEKLIINYRGGYFNVKPDEKYEIIVSHVRKYTEDDIKIKKWLGGVHYYAKIDNIDVIDDYGNTKWNTSERALEISKKYMLKLNNRKHDN